MTDRSLAIVGALVRGWTWIYTAPLAERARDGRRREIASDIWEFSHDRRAGGAAALHLAARALLGVPDDVLWVADQMPRAVRVPRAATIARLAAVVLFASGFAAAASDPAIDLERTLDVDVAASGWTAIATTRAGITVVPALSFTFTNTSDRRTGALQVNAVFYRRGPIDESLGTAFAIVVGGHGLAPGTTTQPVHVRSQTWTSHESARADLEDVAVKLFVQHEGRWTLLGDYPIDARIIDR